MDLQTQLDIMKEPVEQQELIDALSALVLLGDVDFYEAKHVIEDGDWESAIRMVEHAN